MRKNADIAKVFYEIADLLDIQDVQWKPEAYRRAAQAIESLSEDIAVVVREGRVKGIPGIGEGIGKKVEEFVATGKLAYLDKLRKEVPIKVEEFAGIEGLGPKTLKRLYKELGVRTLRDLKSVAKRGKIQHLRGLGEKKEHQLLQSIELAQKRPLHRILLGHAVPIAEEIVAYLKKVPGSERIEVAGSYRRGMETIGDIDILAITKDPKTLMTAFVSMPEIRRVFAKGETKSSIQLNNSVQVDVRVLKKEQYGSALQYFTGSKEHSIELRKRALKKGYTLSEYGMFTVKGKKLVAGKTEEDIYHRLGLDYIPPEMRENLGEIDLAAEHKIPKLIELADIHGDFQTQTTWSDGVHSIEDLARQAQAMGWSFIVITDHVGGIGIANPLDEKRLRKQGKEIDTLNKKLDIRIFKGAEVDIKKDGELALSKTMCNELDVVLASVHSAFRMPAKEMTQRLCSALENYPVTILGHPTGRLINQRDPIDFDLDTVFHVAKDRHVFLEVNGQPTRLDLPDVHIHRAREIGCSFAISSDAHSKEQLRYVRFGVLTARRGWLEKKHVLNTKSSKAIEKILAKK